MSNSTQQKPRFGKLRGTYQSVREMEQAVANFYTEEQVEYPPVFLHEKPSPTRTSRP